MTEEGTLLENGYLNMVAYELAELIALGLLYEGNAKTTGSICTRSESKNR